MTPLHYAAYKGHPEVVKALIGAKADPNLAHVCASGPPGGASEPFTRFARLYRSTALFRSGPPRWFERQPAAPTAPRDS